MTSEQREHIATTIGMLEVLIAQMKDEGKEAMQYALVAQTEILQEMLDHDRRDG